MANRLDQILAGKREEVARKKALRPESAFDPNENGPPRGFLAALRRARAEGRFGLIAEIKRKSPSKGLIRADFDPEAIARSYARAGASCLSVLTDEPWFDGRDSYLALARRAAPALPALRKDFIVDPWQIAEARALGADAILLIVAALADAELQAFEERAFAFGMDVLVEVHDEAELERALCLKTPLVGINSRNLKTMGVDVERAKALAQNVPQDRLVVAESGLSAHADLVALRRVGVSTFLVGEGLMRHADVEAATRALLGGP